jgi:hypothetical protein
MTAYVVLYAITLTKESRPFSRTTPQLSAEVVSIAIAAFLAWRVTRGGAISRGIIVVYTAGWIAGILWSPGMKSGGLVGLGLLASCLAQIALLVSTPIYERTRKDWADRPAGRAVLWPVPPWWMAAAGLAAGLLITLLFLGSMGWKSVPCAPSTCVTLAEGFPVHFLSAVPAAAGAAYPAISKGAAAEDITVWSVLSFAACYLIWLPARRPSREPVGRRRALTS